LDKAEGKDFVAALEVYARESPDGIDRHHPVRRLERRLEVNGGRDVLAVPVEGLSEAPRS